MIVGLIVSFTGGSWDITYHILSRPESFFSYPHTLVYSGILLVISAYFANFSFNFGKSGIVRKNRRIIMSGILLIIIAGPFDFAWHLRFGLDGLLSPPHLFLLTGWLLVALGNLGLTTFTIAKSNLEGLDNNHNYAQSFKYHKPVQKPKGLFANYRQLLKQKKIILYLQLFLNLFILLMIFSGFLYFFSLPFSETKSYNFNPPPLLGLLVYSIGFSLLISLYFQYILAKYQFFYQVVPLIGIGYVLMTWITQIASNPYLYSASGFYLLNLISFGLLYLLLYKKSKQPINSISGKAKPLKFYSKLSTFYMVVVLPILTYSLAFPLNVYIYNEAFYGYLIFQNVVISVYQQIILDFFVIVFPLTTVGGLLGYFLYSAYARTVARHVT